MEKFIVDDPQKYPNFWGAALLLILLFAVQIFITILIFALGFNYEAGDPMWLGIIIVLSNSILISQIIKYKKIPLRRLINPSPNSLKSIALVLGLPIFLVTSGAIFWLSDISNLIERQYPLDEQEFAILVRLMSGGLTSILLVCIIAPLFEELLFRGIILNSFLNHYSPQGAIFLSSLLFALYHLNIYQMPAAFLIGYFSGWLYFKTQSLWPSILSHCFYNSGGMLLWSQIESPNIESITAFNSLSTNLSAVICTILGLHLLLSIFNHKTSEKDQ